IGNAQCRVMQFPLADRADTAAGEVEEMVNVGARPHSRTRLKCRLLGLLQQPMESALLLEFATLDKGLEAARELLDNVVHTSTFAHQRRGQVLQETALAQFKLLRERACDDLVERLEQHG